MKTVTFEMCSPRLAMANLAQDVEAGIPDTSARMVFASEEVLSQVMSEARWEIVNTLCGAGAMQVIAIATRLSRDVQGVETDIAALLKAGVLDSDGQQGVIFPYEQIFLDLPTTGRSTV
jgi:predicted transcriptional regulator